MIKLRPMTYQSWQNKFATELDQAKVARIAGNEGKARVCARRAAGIVIGEYLKGLGDPIPNPSAYDRLRYMQNHANLPEATQEIISHFLVRVDTDRNFPFDIDLIRDAEWLAKELHLE